MFVSPPAKSGVTPPAGVTDGSRASMVPSIVHLGVGGFFRSHMAVYCEDLIADSKQRDQVMIDRALDLNEHHFQQWSEPLKNDM